MVSYLFSCFLGGFSLCGFSSLVSLGWGGVGFRGLGFALMCC